MVATYSPARTPSESSAHPPCPLDAVVREGLEDASATGPAPVPPNDEHRGLDGAQAEPVAEMHRRLDGAIALLEDLRCRNRVDAWPELTKNVEAQLDELRDGRQEDMRTMEEQLDELRDGCRNVKEQLDELRDGRQEDMRTMEEQLDEMGDGFENRHRAMRERLEKCEDETRARRTEIQELHRLLEEETAERKDDTASLRLWISLISAFTPPDPLDSGETASESS